MEAKNILFAFTEMGRQTAGRIVQALGLPPEGVRCFVPERLQVDGFEGFENLAQVVGTLFAQAETLVFVGAAGIAVRAAAPYLESKLTDPAVIVVDEQARYVIPILSGHVGGANAYAQHLAVLLGALPVITTATDLRDQFSVDTYAKQRHLAIVEKDEIKHLSGALLDGEPIGALTPECGFVVSPQPVGAPFAHTLHLVPQDLVVGMGCRSQTPPEQLYEFVEDVFEQQKWSLYRIRAVASIDVKQAEPGLLALAERLQVPFLTYPAEKLCAQQGIFAGSDFVRRTVGVDNVCERSALCAAVDEGWLPRGSRFERYMRLPKQAKDGMTMAVVGLCERFL